MPVNAWLERPSNGQKRFTKIGEQTPPAPTFEPKPIMTMLSAAIVRHWPIQWFAPVLQILGKKYFRVSRRYRRQWEHSKS
jgi:hypothetical protein